MWNEYHRQSDLSLDIELTTYCNARCPQCSRTDQNDVNKRKHWLPLKQVTYNQFKKEREELENTEPFWDGTKWTRRPKPGLNTVIPTTTKLG